MPTITTEMIHAAQRVLVRHTVAVDQGIPSANVTEDAVDVELAELREEDEADRVVDPELPSFDEIFTEMLAAALNAAAVPA